jgi:hypothetical protein
VLSRDGAVIGTAKTPAIDDVSHDGSADVG